MQGCKNARLQGPVRYRRVAEGKGVIMLFSEIIAFIG